MTKKYEDYLKIKNYQMIAEVLEENIEARKDDRILLMAFYKKYANLTLDEAFCDEEAPKFHTVCRMARRLKAVNNHLKYDKSQEQYKEIGLEIPVAVHMI